MIRQLDRCWFRMLAAGYYWILRRARAHCRREMLRRLRRHVAWQKAHLN